MNIRVLLTEAERLKELRRLGAWAKEIYLAYAWASSSKGEAVHWRALPLGKITRAVIGVHFAQTEPFALQQLRAYGVLRVVAKPGDLFHPKLILGIRKGRGRAIVGSSNFTAGGFGANTEVNLVIEGERAAGPLHELFKFVDRQWDSRSAFEPSDSWLAAYARSYASRPRPASISASAADDRRIEEDSRRRTFNRWLSDHRDGTRLTKILSRFTRALNSRLPLRMREEGLSLDLAPPGEPSWLLIVERRSPKDDAVVNLIFNRNVIHLVPASGAVSRAKLVLDRFARTLSASLSPQENQYTTQLGSLLGKESAVAEWLVMFASWLRQGAPRATLRGGLVGL